MTASTVNTAVIKIDIIKTDISIQKQKPISTKFKGRLIIEARTVSLTASLNALLLSSLLGILICTTPLTRRSFLKHRLTIVFTVMTPSFFFLFIKDRIPVRFKLRSINREGSRLASFPRHLSSLFLSTNQVVYG